MDLILGIAAGIVALTGFFFLSEATMGVGIIGIACLIGIFTRIAQASKHQKELKKLLQKKESKLPGMPVLESREY